MLPEPSKKLHKNIARLIVFTALAMLFFTQNGMAQSLGDPIVHITFGSGANPIGPGLAADSGSTTYQYIAASPDDGQYTIANTTAGLNDGWITIRDHTGDPYGYMMIANASFQPQQFYTRQINGLCDGTTYQFAAWVINLLKVPAINPNITFSIETPAGDVLASYNPGDILATQTWNQYAFTFKTPPGVESVVVKMTNNAPGGIGNDVAIDDITFRPYGTPVSVAFGNVVSNSISYCQGSPQMITIQTTTQLDPAFEQKLQVYENRQWIDRSAPTTATSFTFLGPDTAGNYSYRVVKSEAKNITSPQCVVASNSLSIVVEQPLASFAISGAVCQNDTIFFADQSSSQSTAALAWHWDFGDGQTSTLQNPSHHFNSPGDYQVKLTVNTPLGCSDDTVRKVHITALPKADFTTSTPDCIGQAITFTDNSTSSEGSVFTWKWDFGDGKTEIHPLNTPFQHVYDTLGVYNVKLTVITDKGCTSTITKTVKISTLPKANFILPKVCLTDAYALFTDSSSVADNTPLTYSWNFGDDNANAANPNTSTAQNPTHKYTAAKQYQVTLTVTTVTGCQQTLTKSFTVNGAEPKADFNVLNASSLCGNQYVGFKNQSGVDFGSITKVVWFYDTSDLSITETDNNPYSGKLYQHKYPAANTQQNSTNYQVRMLAYSGESCVSEKDTTITVFAASSLTFNAPDSVCQNFGPVQFNVTNASAVAGSGTYTGTGVTPAGLFDPAKAGVGTFKISYVFIASTGCADTVFHQIKVNPVGSVDAGPDISILGGATTTLNAKATGDSLTYQWSPAVGLSSSTILNPVLTADKDITYTLTATNKYGCSVSDQVNITVYQTLQVPNTFTPNGDGVNDTWVIKYLDTYPGCTVDVFNRYGQKVYQSVNYSAAGWDGRYKGADLPVGVYYYIIDPKHGRAQISGYVTIVR